MKFLKPDDDDQFEESHEYYQAFLHLVMFQPKTPLQDLVLGKNLQALELSVSS